MPPMQRMRAQGGFGRMMGPAQFQGGGPFSMRGGFNRPTGGMQHGPFMGQMMGRPQQPQRSGGFLAKLLGKGGNPAGTVGAGASSKTAGAGSLLKSLGNPETINGFLSNTQQVINAAQSFGPVIQQYGPLVKNLPAMWRLYKGLKDTGTEATSETMETEDIKNGKKKRKVLSKEAIKSSENKVRNPAEKSEDKRNGNSVPRLYI